MLSRAWRAGSTQFKPLTSRGQHEPLTSREQYSDRASLVEAWNPRGALTSGECTGSMQ